MLVVERPDVVGKPNLESIGDRGGLAQAPALLGPGKDAKVLLAPDPLHPLLRFGEKPSLSR